MAKSPDKPYKPTDEQLRKAPPRVLYERDMFFASFEAFWKLHHKALRALNDGQKWTQEDEYLRKITLEATLLHARNILDFFTHSPTHQDDIQAAHFLPDSTGWSDKLESLRDRRDDLNFSLSHLTYRRTENRPEWSDLPKIADEVRAAFEEFISLLPKDEQSRWTSGHGEQKKYSGDSIPVDALAGSTATHSVLRQPPLSVL